MTTLSIENLSEFSDEEIRAALDELHVTTVSLEREERRSIVRIETDEMAQILLGFSEQEILGNTVRVEKVDDEPIDLRNDIDLCEEEETDPLPSVQSPPAEVPKQMERNDLRSVLQSVNLPVRRKLDDDDAFNVLVNRKALMMTLLSSLAFLAISTLIS